MRYTQARNLLGTSIEVTVISEDEKTPSRIEYIFDYFSSIEQEFSRFLPDSSLSLLNTYKKANVSKRFIELIHLSKQMYEKTNGFFNPLVSVAQIGYSHTFESGEFEQEDRLINTDFSQIEIHNDTISLKIGQSLDFWGIAKGWAVDKGSILLHLFGYNDFFVNAGGDIYASGNSDTGPWWIIGIESPFTQDVIASLCIQDSAIATSGSYKRKWDIDGKHYHHIINPITGKNEDAIVSVTLIAPECAVTDAFTKIIFNTSIRDGVRLIEQNGMEGMIFTSAKQLLTTKGLEEKYHFTLT